MKVHLKQNLSYMSKDITALELNCETTFEQESLDGILNIDIDRIDLMPIDNGVQFVIKERLHNDDNNLE